MLIKKLYAQVRSDTGFHLKTARSAKSSVHKKAFLHNPIMTTRQRAAKAAAATHAAKQQQKPSGAMLISDDDDQRLFNQEAGTTGSEDEEAEDNEQTCSGSEDNVEDNVEDHERIGSHAAAGAGPSSASAGKQPDIKKHRGVAFMDAASLLPADLDEAMLHRTLQQLQPRHRMQKQTLLQSYREQFSHWRFLLRQHFSLLFYGFGSKQALLEQFAKESLVDGGVMACYGHQPNVNSKQILLSVAIALTHRSCKSQGHSELLGLINAEPACRQLYVIVHNIDGPGLRAPEEQLWLSRLSQAPAVHLIASIDHVNAALLWDNRTAAAFKWLWVDATSYAAYEAETSNILPILTSCKQSAAKRGAATVLSSLVSTARDVFKLLASVQLDDPSAPGVSFPLLLRMVRERFIVNTEHALKSVLTEFRDHELIKLRLGPDGGDVMYIPMEPEALQQALQEMEEAATA